MLKTEYETWRDELNAPPAGNLHMVTSAIVVCAIIALALAVFALIA